MNKRQAKKHKKKQYIRITREQQAPRFDADIDRNGEGYSDPTAGAAIRKLTREGY